MTPEDASEFIQKSVHVTQPDIIAAKQFLLEQGTAGGYLVIEDLARCWANEYGESYPEVAPLYEDPTPFLEAYARQHSLRLAVFRAAWSLIRSGIFFSCGTIEPYIANWTFSTRGNKGGLNLQTLNVLYPEKLFRPQWNDQSDELNDADLYLRQLGDVSLHSGVESALRTALTCLRQDLYDPAVAMLGSAMEGSWVELGDSLLKAAGNANTGKPGKTVQDERSSIKTRIDAVCDLYERSDLYDKLWKKGSIKPSELRHTAQWSHVVRESRNVLHWKVSTKPYNSYSKVATLLMAALKHLGTLHHLRYVAAQKRKPG